jgi:hypothetical protein
MNESSFRQLLHKAIGDSDPPAHLSSQTRMALRQSVAMPPARQHEALIVIAALLATFAVLVALLVPRLFTHIQQPVGVSSPSPSPLAPSPTPDANACRIPVVVNDSSSLKASKLTAGFVHVGTGEFTADQNASVADLPFIAAQPSQILDLASYDPVVKRWVPSTVVSPDQLSYVHVTHNNGRSELHTYDLVRHQDRIVWTVGASIDFPFWRPDGIYVSANRYSFVDQTYWRVDPASGQATVIDEATFDPYKPLFNVPGRKSMWGGPDPERMFYMLGSPDPGARYTVYVIVDGKRADVYSGVMGDQMDFDPLSVWFDGSRIWFANRDAKYLWSWTTATGLVRHSVQIPQAPGAPAHTLTYRVAGPCIT